MANDLYRKRDVNYDFQSPSLERPSLAQEQAVTALAEEVSEFAVEHAKKVKTQRENEAKTALDQELKFSTADFKEDYLRMNNDSLVGYTEALKQFQADIYQRHLEKNGNLSVDAPTILQKTYAAETTTATLKAFSEEVASFDREVMKNMTDLVNSTSNYIALRPSLRNFQGSILATKEAILASSASGEVKKKVLTSMADAYASTYTTALEMSSRPFKEKWALLNMALQSDQVPEHLSVGLADQLRRRLSDKEEKRTLTEFEDAFKDVKALSTLPLNATNTQALLREYKRLEARFGDLTGKQQKAQRRKFNIVKGQLAVMLNKPELLSGLNKAEKAESGRLALKSQKESQSDESTDPFIANGVTSKELTSLQRFEESLDLTHLSDMIKNSPSSIVNGGRSEIPQTSLNIISYKVEQDPSMAAKLFGKFPEIHKSTAIDLAGKLRKDKGFLGALATRVYMTGKPIPTQDLLTISQRNIDPDRWEARKKLFNELSKKEPSAFPLGQASSLIPFSTSAFDNLPGESQITMRQYRTDMIYHRFMDLAEPWATAVENADNNIKSNFKIIPFAGKSAIVPNDPAKIKALKELDDTLTSRNILSRIIFADPVSRPDRAAGVLETESKELDRQFLEQNLQLVMNGSEMKILLQGSPMQVVLGKDKTGKPVTKPAIFDWPEAKFVENVEKFRRLMLDPKDSSPGLWKSLFGGKILQ